MHPHSTRVRPVLRMKLLRFQTSLQAHHLHRIHDISSQRVLNGKLGADLATLRARASLVEINWVDALEVSGDLALGLRHLLGHLRSHWCRRGGSWVGPNRNCCPLDDGVLIHQVGGGDLIGVGVRDLLDTGVVRHGVCG